MTLLSFVFYMIQFLIMKNARVFVQVKYEFLGYI